MVNLYRCYSGKMNSFLRQKGMYCIFKAKDFKTDYTFWVYEMTQELDIVLKEWTENKPVD